MAWQVPSFSRRTVAGVVVVFVLAIYLSAVIWPLPLFFTKGIPSSSTNIEQPVARNMISGDHLQINYFYWIFSDMLSGKTRFLYNLYEFNTGDDDQRYAPGGYNVPYSFVYNFGLLTHSRAFAWNFMLTSMALLSGIFFYLYMRQLLISRSLALALSCVHIGFPYRWISAMGGSPTGISMVCVPLLALGVHLFIAKRRWLGFFIALAALLIVHANEHHVFLFGVLTLPLPCLIAIFHGREHIWDRDKQAWWGVVGRLLALMAIIGGLGLTMLVGISGELEGSTVASGRTLKEVAGFSPHAVGLFGWLENGINGHAFVGVFAVLFLLLFLYNAVLQARLKGVKACLISPAVLLPLLLWVFLVGAASLSLGIHGPFEYLALRIVRKCIPGMDLIRQPAKINCVVAFFLPVAAALSLLGHGRSRRFSGILALGLSILLALEYIPQVRPTVCLLPQEQGAYKAVRDDADLRACDPRAVVLPLWPGDSSWASLYEYYASLYRVRMVNGYRPIVPPSYYNEAFSTLGSLNCGYIDADVVKTLKSMNIDYIILHEDAFPEQVSPFPVGFTLDRLLGSGFVDLLSQDGSIWAFRLRDTRQPKSEQLLPREQDSVIYFPHRFWDFSQQMMNGGGTVLLDNGTSAALMEPGRSVQCRYVNAWGADSAAITVRVKGTGVLSLELESYTNTVTIHAPDWKWVDLPLPSAPLGGPMRICSESGSVMLTKGFLAAGPWRSLLWQETFSLPASWFYHAGYMDSQGVNFRRDWEPHDRIWYGLGLPLMPGRYRFCLDFESNAHEGELLGSFSCESSSEIISSHVVAGRNMAMCVVDVTAGSTPILSFKYLRSSDLKVLRVRAERIVNNED